MVLEVLSRPARSRRKRVFDVVAASALLVVTMPLLICTYAVVRVALGSPVFFIQMRPGLNEKLFQIIKFRTMRSSPVGPDLPDKDRLTRLGSLLRRTSLDELPELVNVIRGDMSMVGPRPLLRKYLPRYSAAQRRRHETRPGMTGLAQISGRNEQTWEERLRLDVEYIDSWSLKLDLAILVRTIGSVVSGRGVSQPGHVTMREFHDDIDSADDAVGP